MKTPINAETLRHHFTYSWWKYVLALVAGIFLVNFLFTVTKPRIPEEKRVDFYIYGLASEESVNAYMEHIRTSEMPDMESMTCSILYVDETPAAFAIGSRINQNTFDVSFEKGLVEYEGVYSKINNEFAKTLIGFEFINREEDMGIESLRKSKLSYHPVVILKRFKGVKKNA